MCDREFCKHRLIVTARKWRLGQGNVFTGVCLSTEGGWLHSMHHRSHDQGGGSASRGVGLHGGLRPGGWANPLPRDTWDTTGYGQQAGGTHPTGINSCCRIYLHPTKSWKRTGHPWQRDLKRAVKLLHPGSRRRRTLHSKRYVRELFALILWSAKRPLPSTLGHLLGDSEDGFKAKNDVSGWGRSVSLTTWDRRWWCSASHPASHPSHPCNCISQELLRADPVNILRAFSNNKYLFASLVFQTKVDGNNEGRADDAVAPPGGEEQGVAETSGGGENEVKAEWAATWRVDAELCQTTWRFVIKCIKRMNREKTAHLHQSVCVALDEQRRISYLFHFDQNSTVWNVSRTKHSNRPVLCAAKSSIAKTVFQNPSVYKAFHYTV